jgi:hypothetical protein
VNLKNPKHQAPNARDAPHSKCKQLEDHWRFSGGSAKQAWSKAERGSQLLLTNNKEETPRYARSVYVQRIEQSNCAGAQPQLAGH